METPASGTEPLRPGETGTPTLKANKACLPCRLRKVKCDAAAIGLPCSSCTSRQCIKDCVLPVRKSRTSRSKAIYNSPTSRSPIHVSTSSTSTISYSRHSAKLGPSNQSSRLEESKQSPTSVSQSVRQTEADLLYLKILNDAVKEPTEYSQHLTAAKNSYDSPWPEFNSISHGRLWTKVPHLDDIDNQYLVKKGVFDLPPSPYINALIEAYFDHDYPFAPVINRADFIRDYQAGDCSLFLLRVILTPASLHAPTDLLFACGFTSRSAAQESFFSKAKLLYDFAVEKDPLLMLQGSIILCSVILDHPTPWDFGYWFHNAVSLATKLNIRNRCVREDKPRKVLKLYRRIWWSLYILDIFHVFIDTRRSRVLEYTSAIRFRTEDDWETEDVSGAPYSLLSAVTPQQKASPVVHCELCRIFDHCLSTVTKKAPEDPRQLMHPLDAWRTSLAAKMHVDGNSGTDLYYLNIQAMSYRFECILCRLIRRRWQQSRYVDWREWAKLRLRSAILELDTITMRVLASGTLQDCPMSFITTIPALLALHIESALDPTETDLVRSMARISISQTMLVLNQGKDIPALKRAIPVFEEILTKKNLYLIPPNLVSQAPAQSQSQNNSMANASPSPHIQVGGVPSHVEGCESISSFNVDYLGFELLDEWQIGQLDFIG